MKGGCGDAASSCRRRPASPPLSRAAEGDLRAEREQRSSLAAPANPPERQCEPVHALSLTPERQSASRRTYCRVTPSRASFTRGATNGHFAAPFRAESRVGYANPSVMPLGRIRGSIRRVGHVGGAVLAGSNRRGVGALVSVASARDCGAACGCCSGRCRPVGHAQAACVC